MCAFESWGVKDGPKVKRFLVIFVVFFRVFPIIAPPPPQLSGQITYSPPIMVIIPWWGGGGGIMGKTPFLLVLFIAVEKSFIVSNVFSLNWTKREI